MIVLPGRSFKKDSPGRGVFLIAEFDSASREGMQTLEENLVRALFNDLGLVDDGPPLDDGHPTSDSERFSFHRPPDVVELLIEPYTCRQFLATLFLMRQRERDDMLGAGRVERVDGGSERGAGGDDVVND